MLIELFLLVILCCGFYLAYRAYTRQQEFRKLQHTLIDKAFEAAFYSSPLSTLPRSAGGLKLIRSDANYLGDDGSFLQSTRLYKISSEQYVLFICTTGQNGYLKPLSRLEAARHVRTTRNVLEAEFPDLVAVVLPGGKPAAPR